MIEHTHSNVAQSELVKRHLLEGRSISQLSALKLYGIGRLSARIYELRQAGMKIRMNWEKGANGKKWAVYSLGEDNQNEQWSK